MTNFLAVGAGGFIGAALRYGVCLFMISRAGLHNAWGTFCVNFIGCLLIGFLAGFEFKNIQPLKYFLIAGLLGGFTTFSAFSLDALMLLKDGETFKAVLYILSTLLVCMAAVFAGFSAFKLVN